MRGFRIVYLSMLDVCRIIGMEGPYFDTSEISEKPCKPLNPKP